MLAIRWIQYPVAGCNGGVLEGRGAFLFMYACDGVYSIFFADERRLSADERLHGIAGLVYGCSVVTIT